MNNTFKAGGTCTCPSGDGSLRWPCPAHPPEATVTDERGRPMTYWGGKAQAQGACPKCAGPGFKRAKCPNCGEGPWVGIDNGADDEKQAHGGGEVGRIGGEPRRIQQFGEPVYYLYTLLVEDAPNPLLTPGTKLYIAPPSAPVGVELPEGFTLNLAVAESALRKLTAVCPVTPPEAAAIRSVIVGARALTQQPAPSAPVGVEGLAALVDSLREIIRTPGIDPVSQSSLEDVIDRLRALAQQPAAVTQPGAGELSNGSGRTAAEAESEFYSRDFYEEARAGSKPWPGGSDNDR